jgi:predicted KAP-like P-loop ATPase
MLTDDQPIRFKEEDLLGMSAFADQLAEQLMNYESSQALVVGLYGEWGSGKTSVINLTVCEIEAKSKALDEDARPVLVHFNPWMFDARDELVSKFFMQLSRVLGRTDWGSHFKDIGEKLESYTKWLTPLKHVPIVGQVVGVAQEAATGAASGLQGLAEQMDKDLETARTELEKALLEQKHRIIVILDDLDRLTDTEICETMRLIKSVACLPNIVYLLACDPKIVAAALNRIHSGKGTEYLEKMVQVPLLIPEISFQRLEKLLFAGLDKVLADTPPEWFDSVYWSEVYNSGLRLLFTNMRDIRRYLNVLEFSCSGLKGIVNTVDLFALTALSVFEPDVTSELVHRRNLFVIRVDPYAAFMNG